MKRALFFLLLSCDVSHAAAPRTPLEIDDATQHAFSQPVPGLSERERAQFFVGNSYFNQNWLSAPASVQTRDGLGPLFNARSCSSCHFKDGRGRPPEPGEPMRSMLVRVSLPGQRPDPHYGDQLQGEAVQGARGEANVGVRWREQPGQFADGEAYSLRVPTLTFEDLGYGPLPEGLQTSARVAPALIGLGLLEAVPEQAVLERADADDRDHDGISGRPNRVPSAAHGDTRLGRFGWKAEQPTVLDQTAAAYLGDMGLTSRLHTGENHQLAQAIALPSGGSPELTDQVLDATVLYARTLAVPRPRDARGADVFERAGCPSCHTPTLTTAANVQPAVLATRSFHAYTDLLLHDMGTGLSDQRPVHDALGSEWRTPPLWGIGLVERVNGHTTFLHDGRARDLGEAILWHDGEGARAKQAFLRMTRDERQALLAFLESL
ncbi:MAG: di-heme oxidoredictase family protein [Polyangiales bacterium]